MMNKSRKLNISSVILSLAVLCSCDAGADAARSGRVKVEDHCLVDDNGPFLGLGASYFTALWRCKNDRERLESDLAFLADQGFNYYRMLSMVGYYGAWDALEIAPVDFTSREGKKVAAWPDYWQQLRTLIDLAFDDYGLRTQITIFADAQLMPAKSDRIAHMQKLLESVVPGREQKIILLEVANEAWQNGFPGEEGVADLREFAHYLSGRTEVPVAISSNHNGPGGSGIGAFERVYGGADADIATWHFSRDRRPDGGWQPVYDCWEYADRPGLPPVSSNEPIGPGSSVSTENDPLRLVTAAAFAYTARVPMYVFHTGAGVFGKTRFEEMPGIEHFQHLLELLPEDLPNWERNDGKGPQSPLMVFANGEPDKYWPEVDSPSTGCVRNIGARKGDRFVTVPIGILPDGLTLQARYNLEFTTYNPLTGNAVQTFNLKAGDRASIPGAPEALIVIGRMVR